MFLKKVFQFRTKNLLKSSFRNGRIRLNFSSQTSSERTLPVPVDNEFSYLKPITEAKADEILLDTFNLLNQNVQQLDEIGKLPQGKDEILEKFYIMLKYTRKQYYYTLQYHDVLLPIPSYGLDENLKTDDDIKYVSCFKDIAGAYSNTNTQIKAHILDIDTLISQKCFRQSKLKVFSDEELRSTYLESLDALLKDGDVRRKIVHSYSKSRRLTVKEKLKLLQPVVYIVQRLILENQNYHDVLDWVQYRLALERWLHAVGNHDPKLLEQTRLVNEDILTVILGTYDFKQKVYRIIITGFFVFCFLLCIFLFLMGRKVDGEFQTKI